MANSLSRSHLHYNEYEIDMPEFSVYLHKVFTHHGTYEVLDTLYNHMSSDNLVCLAGGVVRSFYENRDMPRDVDLFLLNFNRLDSMALFDKVSLKSGGSCLNRSQVLRTIQTFYLADYPSNQIISIQYADIAEHDIKSVKREQLSDKDFTPVSSVSEVLSGFDFTCAQGGLAIARSCKGEYELYAIQHSSRFLGDVCRRRLHLVKPSIMYIPPTPLRRLHKYLTEYGYRFDENDMHVLDSMEESLVYYVNSGGSSYDAL